ncbi:hypothetical protein ABID26_001129 [Mesorhizobium shonense]|uniref:Uncharacterized protein n=1 Tax=Mesorhizobium shonense TaxID=1209948 RepID=A0ABV2HMF2_9HYPH
MEALQALVLTNAQLRELFTEAAKQGAALAVRELRADVHQTPEDASLQKLRAYLADPASLANHKAIGRTAASSARSNPRHAASRTPRRGS